MISKLQTILLLFSLTVASFVQATDALPSWHTGSAKQDLVQFVENVTTEGSEQFVPVEQRIAVFDNDGTLWSEQPIYFQFAFVVDRIKALADQHPEWKTKQPYKAILEGDIKTALKSDKQQLVELLLVSHAGNTVAEFSHMVKDWLATAKHPTTNQLYTEMVFQPMLELLSYLRANGFKTYIVSGGGIEFMRPWTEAVYGIPPEQVIGSSVKTKFEMRDGKPVLVRLPEFNFIDDKAGKPVAINQHIGRRPIAAFGNSDGDLQMLQWVAAGSGESLSVLIHHTDEKREWAYDRESHIGRLDKAMDEAADNGWTVVDMKKDWKAIYPKN
jgi:phosphoserine phosphatase